jgi:hypothetical protein
MLGAMEILPLAAAVLPTVAQDASPLHSTGPPTMDDSGGLVDGLDTKGPGDGFVIVRDSPGDCVGVGIPMAGTGAFVVATNADDMESGRGSDLNTPSKRARRKNDNSVNPL